MTNTRRPNIQQHSARPAPTTAAPTQTAENEHVRMEYIKFLGNLLHLMGLESLERMLDHALDELK